MMVIEPLARNQGRAKGLYDEQLQRQQQERRLFKAEPARALKEVREPDPVR